MSHHYATIQFLRQQGYRLTPQREMVVLAILDQEGHFTAEEVYRQVRRQSEAVNIATIYRTLDLLCDLGILTAFQVAGEPLRYERADSPSHHHLICRQCGTMIDLPDQVLHPLQEMLLDQYNFAAEFRHIAISGLCAHCRDAQT